MKNPIDQGSIETKLAQFVQKYFDPKIKDRLKLYFQPLADVRLEALPGDTETNTNKETLMVVSLVSVLVLLLASVNYMNLSTARQSKRSREVGLLKVIGAKRSQIGFQFLFESLVITYVAILLALLLTYLILPAFNVIIERNLALEFTDWSVWLVLMMLGLVLGVISGIYPAVVLSTFGPLNALRTSFSTKSGIGVRKALVIFQFTCTMVLLIAIGTIYVQMTYLQNLEMDIDRDRYVFLRSKEDVYSNFESYERFKTQLTAHADIQKVAGTWSIPFGVNAPVFFYPFQAEGTPQNEKVHMHLFRADHDFIETFDLKVIQGRNFSRDFATDPTSAFLLNEQAVKELGWEGDAIGKELEVFSGGGNAFKKGKVIGIVQDLNFQPLHKSIGPMVVSMTNNQRYRYIAIRLTSQQTGTAAIDYVRSVWSSFAPQWPAELFYLEDEWNQNYEQEERLAGIMELLTVIGIFIASLGLFALASFIMEQRQKEVGIRKVLGATVGIIVRLLSLDFMIPLLIAFAIAVPIGWYLSLNWLDQFAYRITPAWWLFLGVLGISVVLSLVTISYHSLKVAIINPAVILKNE